jgi:hypothetical protein
MKNLWVSAAIALAALLMIPSSTLAQRAAFDLSGVWQMRGVRSLSDESPPMTLLGQQRFDANKPSYGDRAIPPALGNDPTGKCDPLGFVRSLFGFRPFEFVVVPGRVFQFFEWTRVWREIWTDGRELPQDPDPRFYGYSVGRWEGDTFVVNSTGFDDRTWLDQFGHPYSGEMRIEERWRRAGDNLELTMTLVDPVMYSAPWVAENRVFAAQPGAELREELCVPSQEEEFNRRVRNPAGGLVGPAPE